MMLGCLRHNDMLSLKEIVSIREIIPNTLLEGETRETIYPHDRFEIEGTLYRVNSMNKHLNTTSFSAVVQTLPSLG